MWISDVAAVSDEMRRKLQMARCKDFGGGCIRRQVNMLAFTDRRF
jgi:hypothetical protein